MEGVPKAWVSNEPIGPESSVHADDHPVRLIMAAVNAWVCGAASYTLHTGAGVRGGGIEDLGYEYSNWDGKHRGRSRDFQDVANIEATLTGLVRASQNLPADMANWSQQNGNERYRDYPFDWTELREAKILRAYVAMTGDRFVGAPTKVVEDTTFRAKRPMQLQVITPLDWTVIQDVQLGNGGTIVLPGTQGDPKDYVLMGTFR
jgi:hypothetical protein